MTRHVITLAIALVVCAGSGLALAQPSNDKAAAEALFAEGRTLMKQGQHARACEKFAASGTCMP